MFSASAVYVAARFLYPSSPKLLVNNSFDVEDDDDDESDDNTCDSDEYSPPPLTKWPWDQLRKTVRKSIIKSVSFMGIKDYEEEDDDTSTTTNNINKTGACIGEIFGLDVGGTLTKLVYFEQQIKEYKQQTSYEEGLHRREHYNEAASALEVLQARRSASTTGITRHSTDSDADLESLWLKRQESVPDRLNEYSSSVHMDHVGALLTPDRGDNMDGSERSISSSHNEEQTESPVTSMKRSRSMINISKSSEHAEALDNFYSFARRLDTYETAKKDHYLSYYSRYLNGTFHFIRFETRRMSHAMNLMRYNNFHRNIKEIGATGGGAHKFAQVWKSQLGITMAKQSEMDCLVAGMQFVMQDIVGECYTFKPSDWTPQSSTEYNKGLVNGILRKTPPIPRDPLLSEPSVDENSVPGLSDRERSNLETNATSDTNEETLPRAESSNSEGARPRVDQWWTSKKVQRDNVTPSDLYPYLLVSIGTGVSILRVDGPRKSERISGSTIGGGTYWGLCRLLTGSDSFSDVLDLAMKGDPSKVDMMVGDIYGKNSKALEKVGLPADIVASSFGKLVTKTNPSEGIKEEDLARALLLMVTNNIGQVAHLNAKLYKTRKIYFVGTFLQHNVISQQRLAYSIDYWSQGKMEAQFLEHEVSTCFCLFPDVDVMYRHVKGRP